MKMFKRLAAALLAGVMVLAMLTACGGDGAAKTDAQKMEDLTQKVYNAALGTELPQDATLQNAAKKYLNENLTNGVLSASAKETAIVSEPDKDGNVVVVSIVSTEGMTDEALKEKVSDPSVLDKEIADLKSQPGYTEYAALMKQFIKAMGSGTAKSGDKTFVAVAIRVPKVVADAMV